MKKLIFITALLFLFTNLTFSQVTKQRNHRSESRIERLEKLKLIESLDLDEEKTLIFFARRTAHRKSMKNLQDQAENKMFEIEKILISEKVNEAEVKKLIDEYSILEKNIFNERIRFITSLNDIFSAEQIAKLMIFERKFKQEIKDVIIRDRQRRKN
ncbi:MAG: hypothetical protein KGZ85_04800 [Ignavibacterium sp.]|nr:hypothetical protein [Ignavibacterium sp.]